MSFIFLLAFLLLESSVTYAALDYQDYGENLQQMSKRIHDECDLIIGIDQEEIDAMKRGTFPDSERVQRYVLCLFIASNTIHHFDLTLNTEVMNHDMPKQLTNGTQMYLNCLEGAKKSGVRKPHLIVWNMIQCVYETDPEHFIIF